MLTQLPFPFLRFGNSNPSPRYVNQCTNAFRSGHYESGSTTFGNSQYGCLESTVAAILLDREATSLSLSLEPSHGALREPILQVLNILRSMEYQTKLPDNLDGPSMHNDYQVKLWKIHEKVREYHIYNRLLSHSTLTSLFSR